MAKNDFFVIAYKILAYLYKCMQEGETPDIQFISAESLEINKKYWCSIVTELYKNGYIEGVREINLPGAIRPKYVLDMPEITMKGIEYLQENSMMEKAKRAIKELKDIIPGL
jgi:hypothetical protein